MDWLPWAPLMAASLHMSEEFLVPGGFLPWYRRYNADPSRISVRFLMIVNAALLIVCWNIGSLGRTTAGIAYWLTVAALLCSNGCWHAWASCKSRTYSPGTITGVAVYLPLAAYGYFEFIRSGAISPGLAAAACLLGGSYQLWSAAYHKRWAKRAAR